MADLEIRTLATGLQFPEGPVVLSDGSIVVTEIARGTLTRVAPDGSVDVVAECGGGPNGIGVGPDGKLYVANNGGYFSWFTDGGITIPGPTPDTYTGGSIQRVDVDTGEVETLYEAVDGAPLVAPNDLQFDGHGGFWFTDHGVQGGAHADRPGLLYATADGSRIEGKAWGTDATNGVGLSPAGDRVVAAETHTGMVWTWEVVGPGQLAAARPDSRTGGRLLYDGPEGHLYDSLAVDGEGWVCVATIGPGGITTISPDGQLAELLTVPDEALVTNLCFGGRPEDRTAYVTCSSTGVLVEITWPRVGWPLPPGGEVQQRGPGVDLDTEARA